MNQRRPFHQDATPIIFGYAKDLKKDLTEAEKIMWEKLRDRRLDGLKFRRQHPIGKFILDFYCHELKLAIEIDGNIHERDDVKEKDAGRTYMLKERGISILRFTNEEVITNIASVLNTIINFSKR